VAANEALHRDFLKLIQGQSQLRLEGV